MRKMKGGSARCLLVVLLGLCLLSARSATATTIFTFEADNDGWSNHPLEPFSATFAPGEGLGGGALLISATVPRDSYQIAHVGDQDWPIDGSFFEMTFDFRPVSGAALAASSTGIQIRDSFGNKSAVYLLDHLVPLGGGWQRAVLLPSAITNLPESHPDPGINLHIRIGPFFVDAPVMFIDNITRGAAPVPAPASLYLFGFAAACGSIALRRRAVRE